MKNKFLIVLLIGAFSFALCACGETATEATAPTGASTEQQGANEGGTAGQSEAEATATPTPEPTEAPHEHNYTEEITVEATCETDGEKTFSCECGDSYTEVIAATGHVFNYVYNEDATYLADGTETATCENCDETDTRTAEGTMLTYTYTDMSATKYAKQTVNIRTLPSTDGEKIGALSPNDEITITGQCNETGWYRFEYNGHTAYVAGNYVSDNKVEVAPSNGGSTVVSNEPCPYKLNVWTIETTEYGLHVYVLYSTKYDILTKLGAENAYLFEKDANGKEPFIEDVAGQVHDLHLGVGTFHYAYPIVNIGTYAEGTVYRYTAGVHISTNPNGCPNQFTGTCQPGTID